MVGFGAGGLSMKGSLEWILLVLLEKDSLGGIL